MTKRRKGRLPDQQTRAEVAALVAACKGALRSPDGHHCINPNADPVERSYMQKDQVLEIALNALQMFAQHGDHFAHQFDVKRMRVIEQVNQRRADGDTYEGAVEKTGNDFGASVSTVSRLIRPVKNVPLSDGDF